MKLDLNKFYNTNYKDFVHKEAVEEALRMVAEIDLKDVEIDTILSITFSVDESGENPMYVEYLDKDGKKHIVRIRPAVTNQINETKNDILSYVDVEVGELREYVDSRDAEYHELAKQYADNVKQEAVNNSKTYTDTKTAETLETSKTYTDTKHSEVTQNLSELQDDVNTKCATKQELITNVESLYENDQQNFDTLNDRINAKTTVYKKNMSDSVRYYFPQINVTTKTDGDIILEGKDETTVKLANLLNDEQLAKLKNLPTGQEIDLNKVNKKTNSYIWDKNIERTIDFDDGNEVFYDVLDDKITKIAIREKTGASQKIVLFDQFLTLENLSTIIGDPQPLEINVSYKGSELELNNYSSYTTIGNSTIVNINCNFIAPFISWSAPLLNPLNITSETLNSFPDFMIDCIVKTATDFSSYTTTTKFSNKTSTLYVETPVIKPNETIAISLISFNGSYIFNNTKEAENDE